MRNLFFISLVSTSILCMNPHAKAEDITELKKVVESIRTQHQKQLESIKSAYQKEIADLDQRHQDQMAEVMERLQDLEQKQNTTMERTEEPAAPKDLLDRVEYLEDELTFYGNQQKRMASQIEDKVDFHIYATAQFENFEDTGSTFNTSNIAFAASADLTDRLKIMSIFELEPDRLNGGIQVELDQGYIEYKVNDYFKPRFGIMLVPFGRFNIEHFDIINDLSSRPLLNRRIIPVSWEEAGAGFTGTAVLSDLSDSSYLQGVIFNYQFYFINGLTNNLTDTSTRGAVGAFDKDNNNNKAFVGRLGIHLSPAYEIGLSGYWGKYDSEHSINGLNVDWKFTFGPAEFLGEYAFFDLETGGLQTDGITTVPNFYHGGYMQGNYHFWLDFLNETFLGRYFESPTFTAVIRYGIVKIADDGDANMGDNRERSLSFGINYRPTETWALKIEYQFNSDHNETIEHGKNNGLVFSVTSTF